jgi:hypothetical protein
VNWNANGMPRELEDPNDVVAPIDWSARGMPVIMQMDKRDQCVDEVRSIDWSMRGMPWQFKKMMTQTGANEYRSVDWSKKGLPMTFGSSFDDLILDWSTRGIPRGGKPCREDARAGEMKCFQCIDWSMDGMPVIMHDATYFSAPNSMFGEDQVVNANRITPKHYITHYQEDFAIAESDYHLLTSLKPNFKVENHPVERPVNKTRNEIRGAKDAHRVVHSKKTKKALLILLHSEGQKTKMVNRRHKEMHRAARRKRAIMDKEAYDGKFEHPCDLHGPDAWIMV